MDSRVQKIDDVLRKVTHLSNPEIKEVCEQMEYYFEEYDRKEAEMERIGKSWEETPEKYRR